MLVLRFRDMNLIGGFETGRYRDSGQVLPGTGTAPYWELRQVLAGLETEFLA